LAFNRATPGEAMPLTSVKSPPMSTCPSGSTATENTCYAHVGSELARLKPQDATIRFWGLKSRGLVVHGDAILGDGTVISDSPPEDYARKGYELVSTLPLATFLAHVARVG
jgi:hypothetical protein